jgi:hypothetical protein
VANAYLVELVRVGDLVMQALILPDGSLAALGRRSGDRTLINKEELR